MLWNWCFVVFIAWWFIKRFSNICAALFFEKNLFYCYLSSQALRTKFVFFCSLIFAQMYSSSLGEYCWVCPGPYFRWLNIFSLRCFEERSLMFWLEFIVFCTSWNLFFIENGFQILFYGFDFRLQVGDCFVAECYDIFPFRIYVGKRDLDPTPPYCVTSPKTNPNLYHPPSVIQTSESIVMQTTHGESPDKSNTWQICDSNTNV